MEQLKERKRRRSGKTDLERIVTTAWTIVDEEGLEGLSTRRLATRLLISGPALYHHVPSMQALFGMMIEQALKLATTDILPGSSWQDWFRDTAIQHRRALLAHRDSGRIASLSAPSTGMADQFIPGMAEPLIRAGFSHADAYAAVGWLGAFVLGAVITEQQEAHRRFATSFMQFDQLFDFSLQVMIDGLDMRLAQRK